MLLLDHKLFTVNFFIPDDSDIVCVKDWFIFLDLCDQEETNLIGTLDQESYQKILLQYGLLLSKINLRLIKIPVFESFEIISIEESKANDEKKGFKAEVDIPIVDFMPLQAYEVCIRASLDLVIWMSKNLPNEKNLQNFYTVVLNKIIRPFDSQIPGAGSTIPLLKVAHGMGIPFAHWGLGVYQLGWGSKSKLFDRSSSESDSAIAPHLSLNKVVSANITRLAGIPSPTHLIINDPKQVELMASKVDFPIVVKPADCERGEGVTVDIDNVRSLISACDVAFKVSKSKVILIEKQIQGVCHRIFICNKKLLYAVKRNPIYVIGDGKKTIRQLIEAEVKIRDKQPPWKQVKGFAIDDILLRTINKAGLTLDSILGHGIRGFLRPNESTEWGGIDDDVTSLIHPDNIDLALRCARLFGLDVAGIDFITDDIAQSWKECGGIINEVNFCPLLGGAEISRSYIGEYLSNFIEGSGKIPIKTFENEQDAIKQFHTYLESGVKAFMISGEHVIDFNNNLFKINCRTKNQKIKALLMNKDVDAIVISQ